MNKKVSFEKKIKFPTMIGEICSISLEKDFHFHQNSIEGDLLLSGKYKLTEASLVEEDFQYKIPIDISLSDRVDPLQSKIEISDFYYEIENDDTMICYIDLDINGEEIIEEIEDRECDGDMLEDKEIEIPVLEKEEEKIEEDKREEEIVEEDVEEKSVKMEEEKSIFPIIEGEDTYGTFLVYIVRENETINMILEKYHTTLEKIEQYNDLNQFNIGTKLIIPLEKTDE